MLLKRFSSFSYFKEWKWIIQREKLLFWKRVSFFKETFQCNSSFKSLVVIERDESLYHIGVSKEIKNKREREIRVFHHISSTLASLPLINAGVCHFAWHAAAEPMHYLVNFKHLEINAKTESVFALFAGPTRHFARRFTPSWEEIEKFHWHQRVRREILYKMGDLNFKKR